MVVYADAVPGRPARDEGHPSPRDGDHGAGRRLPGGAGRGVLGCLLYTSRCV